MMTYDDKNKGEKIKYNINRAAAEISILSSRKWINMNILQVQKYYLTIEAK